MRHNFAAEAIPMGRAKALAAFGLAVMAAFLLIGVQAATRPAHAATTFVVNSTGDSPDSDTTDNKCFTGAFILVSVEECTLRAAIQQANATPGADTIAFDIPIIDISCDVTSKVCTISPASGLPPITEAVTIDGYAWGQPQHPSAGHERGPANRARWDQGSRQ